LRLRRIHLRGDQRSEGACTRRASARSQWASWW
jgi:hypothetical protein